MSTSPESPYKQPVLPIARLDKSAFLRDHKGAPVWPCFDDEDEQRLEKIAHIFGATITRMDCHTAACSDASDRVVVGLGLQVQGIGSLYAHLTHRRYVQVSAAAAAIEMDNVDVVLCISPTPPHELLDEIARRHLNAKVGVLWATNTVALRRQALIRAAAAKLTPSLQARAVLLSPTAGLKDAMLLGSLQLHGTLKEVRDLNEFTGSAVLVITTHSDGIDAFLGPRLTLCALKDLALEQQMPMSKPKCIVTGECHRLTMPINDALASENLVSPTHLAGRVVVWNSCFGVMGRCSTIAESWGLLPQLLASPYIGGLVALRGIVNTGTSAVVPLVKNLQNGCRIGAAIEAWQQALVGTPAQMLAERLFLFGDPALTVSPGSAGKEAPTSASRAMVDAIAPRLSSAEGGVLRQFLTDARKVSTISTAEVDQCLDFLDAFEVKVANIVPLSAYTSCARALQLALLRVLTQNNWSAWTDSWMHAAKVLRKLSNARCPNCSADLWAGIYQPRPPGSVHRYYANCASCGSVDDRPVTEPAIITISSEQRLKLWHSKPMLDWTGALLSVPVGSEVKWIEWPRDANGQPVPECELPKTGQIGPIFLVSVFISGWHVSLFMRRSYLT